MRCGTSIGSNAEEAREGQSKADFIAKLSISSKEARDSYRAFINRQGPDPRLR